MDYQKIYDDIISRGSSRTLSGYREKHHILPRCLGGADNDENLVYLTPEEHYVCHQILIKLYPGNAKLVYAANMMCVGAARSNKRYGWIRRKLTEPKSEEIKAKMRKPKPPGFGDKISKASKGVPKKYPVWNKGVPGQGLGVPKSEEHRAKISAANKGKKKNYTSVPRGNKWEIIECPHCGKTGSKCIMPRWHFDRCKHKNE